MAQKASLFDCRTCTWGRHCDEANPAPIAQWKIEGVIESRVCFLPMITEQSRFLLRLHSHYQNHWLPYDGGLLSQPNYFLEAMEIINSKLEAQPRGR